ncbi:unnamed protein product [Ascophyllum nodosum]
MILRLMRFYATTLGVVSSSMISSWTPGASAFVASPYVPQSSTLWATTRCINNCKQHHRASSILHHRASGGLSRLSSSSSGLPVAVEEGERRVDPKVTELPDSFEDSITRMGKATLQAMEEGRKLLRVDFDTTAGDETYTTLKSSLEMAKQLTKLLAEALICPKEGETPTDSTLALFFPDAGSAALAKFEWGVGKETAQVPSGVRFCTVKTEGPADTDVGCILLCPRNSEADRALQLVKKIEEKEQFMILVNPELINMGTTGYGLAGRRIRDEIISAFHTTYYLRTLPWGAVTREHGKWYSVWQDDADDPTGYRLLKAVPERPVGDELDEIYDVANGLEEENSSPDFLDSVAKFVRDFKRL